MTYRLPRFVRRLICRVVGHRIGQHWDHVHFWAGSKPFSQVSTPCLRCGTTVVLPQRERWSRG